MLRSLLYTTLWALPFLALYVFFKWVNKPHCPHCQCGQFSEVTAATARDRNRLVVIEHRFECGYSVSMEGHKTGDCHRLAYRRRTA